MNSVASSAHSEILGLYIQLYSPTNGNDHRKVANNNKNTKYKLVSNYIYHI